MKPRMANMLRGTSSSSLWDKPHKTESQASTIAKDRGVPEEFLSSAGNRIEQDLGRFRKFIKEQDSVNSGTGGIPG